MAKFRQTYFGFTAQNTLTIVDRLKIPRGEAFIFRLPDELLLAIFELITLNPRPQESCCDFRTLPNYRTIKTLVFTCHRFNQIALPLLYRTIHFDYPHYIVPPNKAVKSLHHSLHKNPSLRQYCWGLWINIHDTLSEVDVDEFSIANDFASWLKEVRCLGIYGGFDGKFNEPTWALIRNFVQHMGKIEHLTIHRHRGGPSLAQITEHIDIPSLRTLDIHGISKAMNGVGELDPKKHRTASFSRLSITEYQGSAQGTAQLLQWPKQLSHFYFGSLYNNRFNLNLPMFHSWLLMHKDTLRTIDIGYLSRLGRGSPFIASDFPKLEVLRLSRWSMKEDLEFSSTEADSLLAPNLKTFEWDFSIYDQHSESWTDFGKREEDWVRELARAAIERKAALKKIKIIFRPEYWSSKEDGYPWDRMDKIRDEIRPRRMLLEYNQPLISKESWLEEIASDSVLSVVQRRGGILKYFPVLSYPYRSE